MSAHAPHLDDEPLVTEPLHPVEEQFRDAAQQREVATLGMWAFLATEVLFFGALFVAYAVYRIRWPEDFRQGSIDLKWYLGGINTAVLLLSSFSMALAVHAAQMGHNARLIRYLLVTIVLASAFIGIKLFEYYIDYEEHLIPGTQFSLREPGEEEMNVVGRAIRHFDDWLKPATKAPGERPQRAEQEQLFMIFYFVMTGIHATHMVIGIGLMLWLIWMARRRRFSVAWHNPVDNIGLYWHFVDTVWVFLYPILYLLRNP